MVALDKETNSNYLCDNNNVSVFNVIFDYLRKNCTKSLINMLSDSKIIRGVKNEHIITLDKELQFEILKAKIYERTQSNKIANT